jgi:Ca-activated chloride channel family protein
MIFATPMYLLCVPLFVGIVYAFIRFFENRKQSNALSYTSLAFAKTVFRRNIFIERMLLSFVLFGVAAATFALSGPRFVIHIPTHSGSVVLCVDTSGSMASKDIEPTRAEAAMKASHLFVQHLPAGVRVGIVGFASNANTVLPLEADREVIDQAVERIPDPNGATAIGDALLLAEQTLPKDGRRAVVLLTDGVNNRGSDPVSAAQDLALHHITLYTVGIGTSNSGQTIPGTDEAADADPDALREYAELTGGKFFAVKDADDIASAFLALTRETAWSTEQINMATPSAVLGAASLVLGLLFGFALGRFP